MILLHGFEFIAEQHIPEINTQARLWRHQRTGAQLLSMENQDENKVFGITFRTPPPDSSGLPHIMEHSVLCGSQKYPLKEPFVELLKGSLQTFLNAFTYPDKTLYPVASQNLQDFYNLIDVYVDAVFHPLIPAHTLGQEGWHYELDDINAPLTYKGVVFNEMKGAYSDPEAILGRYVQQSLFPDNAYGVDSGGDPREIPNLTYAKFKAFHERYYHPSNAYIYFYGDDDPEQRLRLMAEYLGVFKPIQVDSSIALQPRFDQPRRLTIPFDPGEDPQARKGMLSVNWLLGENRDPLRMLGVQILTHILTGTPAAPLRKALIDSGMGEDLVGGMEAELRQGFFACGLKGMAVDEAFSLVDGKRLESLIRETLTNLAQEGIDPETVAASMNTVEFMLRENNTGAFPRGLLLMLRSLTTWLYDGNPFQPLAFEAPLHEIQERLASGEAFFENLIRELFLENTHQTVVTLQPKPGTNQELDAQERERLAQARARMSQDDLQEVQVFAQELKRLQEEPDSPQALASLPSLQLQDIEKEIKRIPLDASELGGARLLVHDLFTNGILYLDLGFDLHVLPQEYLPYVPLFGRALLEMGTRHLDFVRLSQWIGRSTGGIAPSTYFSPVYRSEKSAAWLFLRGKTTMAQAAELLSILKEILFEANFEDPLRFRQMLLEEKAEAEAGLVPAGHRVINSRLRALFNEADWAAEQTSGVAYLFFLRQLLELVEKDWATVLAALEAMRSLFLNRQVLVCNVTLDEANWQQFRPQLEDFLGDLPDSAANLQNWQRPAGVMAEGLTIPAQVNYVGKGANLYTLGYQRHGSLEVVMNYLRTTWLWEKIRVQGGAYGAFSLFNPRSGVLTFLSYRDPNLAQTLQVYDQTAQFLRHLDGGRLSQDELTRSIIGVIGSLDAYQLPDAKGYTSMARYLVGETDEQRQAWRDQVLGASVQDFYQLADTLERMQDQTAVVVLGGQEALQALQAERPDWLQLRRVL